jgi:hypothetical protein
MDKRYKHNDAHNGAKTKEYFAWHNMRARCRYACVSKYPRYGGRGISVCPEWDNSTDGFANFLAHIGRAPSSRHSLGRIHNDGNYEPGNVEWQLPNPQARNRSNNRLITAFGETLTLAEWSERSKIEPHTILARLDRSGWLAEKAVTERDTLLGPAESRLIELNGRALGLSGWAKEAGMSIQTLRARLGRGWTLQRAITTPVRKE